MYIQKIKLENFRNYENLSLELSPEINVFYGLNGQGKTNLLEAIYLCSCARSHRTAKDQELIRFQQSGYRVSLEFEGCRNYHESLTLAYEQKRELKKRNLFHDGIKLDRVADFMGIFQAVLFAPEDLMLLKEGPQVRRRFMDIRLSQCDPLYFAALQKLARLLHQRNKILKLQVKETELDLLLDTWDEQLAQISAQILIQRKIFCSELAGEAQKFYQQISSSQESMNLRYHSVLERELKAAFPEENQERKSDLEHFSQKESTEIASREAQLATLIVRRLKQNRREDKFRGSTTLGPHRDDLLFFMNDHPAKQTASQGQTRSMVLALKLAELNWMHQKTRDWPVLLLDDVLSELDEKRRKALLSSIKEAQVLVTCTDRNQAELLGKQVHFYQVQQAEIQHLRSGTLPDGEKAESEKN